jgi:hypothetical protein
MDVDDDSSPLAIRVEFFFLLAASQNKNPQLFGTTAAAASTRSETKDERYKKKNLSFSSFFVIGLFLLLSGRSGVFWPGGGPATLLGHSWLAHFSLRRRSLRLLFSILIKSLPFTFYDLHVVAMPERRCAYYYRAMILLCRASSSPSPSRFYSLDMTRVISYTVDEVFRSCFFFSHSTLAINLESDPTQTTVEATLLCIFTHIGPGK